MTASTEPDPREISRSEEANDTLRSSAVRLPTRLAERVRAECAARGFDHGDLLIEALDETLQDGTLEKWLHPAGFVGGGRFRRRSAGAKRRTGGDDAGNSEKSTITFSAYSSDFKTFDQLRKELLVSSVNRLLTAAFEAYFAGRDLGAERSSGTEPALPTVGESVTVTNRVVPQTGSADSNKPPHQKPQPSDNDQTHENPEAPLT